MSTPQDEPTPGPLELLEAARAKYQLALARLRRGPAELALLSLHGAIEDVLRAHGMRLELAAVYEPFPQLLEALTAVRQLPLSAAEAEGIRRMHRLRARVAHGEQIVVAGETIAAYQRLAARLLPRYGVLVVSPGEGQEAGEAAPAPTTPRRGDTITLLRAEPSPARRGNTARLERAPDEAPRRERTVYPDERAARYVGRVRPSKATSDLPLAREWAGDQRRERRGGLDAWLPAGIGRGWLLPALAILTIFLIGAVISISLQQIRSGPAVPTAAVPTLAAPAAAPQLTTVGPAVSAIDGAPPPAASSVGSGPSPAVEGPEAAPNTEGLAPGRTAYVRGDAVALNVRARPGMAPDNPEIFVLAPGTALEIVGGPVEADGFTWWQIRGPTGEGWSAGQYLEVR
jgi:hypothetical protein